MEHPNPFELGKSESEMAYAPIRGSQLDEERMRVLLEDFPDEYKNAEKKVLTESVPPKEGAAGMSYLAIIEITPLYGKKRKLVVEKLFGGMLEASTTHKRESGVLDKGFSTQAKIKEWDGKMTKAMELRLSEKSRKIIEELKKKL